jgi:hypothetical protein
MAAEQWNALRAPLGVDCYVRANNVALFESGCHVPGLKDKREPAASASGDFRGNCDKFGFFLAC